MNNVIHNYFKDLEKGLEEQLDVEERKAKATDNVRQGQEEVICIPEFIYTIKNIKVSSPKFCWKFVGTVNQIMYNWSISFNLKYYLKATSYINDSILYNQSNIMVSYVHLIGLCHSVTILW